MTVNVSLDKPQKKAARVCRDGDRGRWGCAVDFSIPVVHHPRKAQAQVVASILADRISAAVIPEHPKADLTRTIRRGDL